MQKFDDNLHAMQDIAARPDVTEGEYAKAKEPSNKQTQQSAAQPTEIADTEKDERNARIFSNAFSERFESITGDAITQDQVSAIAEIGTLLFSGLRRVPAGNVFSVVIVAVCLTLPFVPSLFKLFNKPKEEKYNA